MLSVTKEVVQGLQTWQVIIYPAITLMFAALLTGAGLWPFLSKRRKDSKRKDQRQTATQDAVLGRDPNPEINDPGVVGLVVSVPRLVRTVGEYPNGETIVGQQRAIKQEQEHVAKELAEHRTAVQTVLEEDQHTVKELLAEHERSDLEHFDALHVSLKAIHEEMKNRTKP